MASVPGRDRTEAGFALDLRNNTRSAGETLMIQKGAGARPNKVLLGITSMMLYAILGSEQSIGHKRNEDPIDHKPTDPGETALHTLGSESATGAARRLPMALLAERTFLSRTTLTKIERGEPGVSAGAYASVLFVLGMVDRLADLADARHDSVGRALDEERLPERVRVPKARKPRLPSDGTYRPGACRSRRCLIPGRASVVAQRKGEKAPVGIR